MHSSMQTSADHRSGRRHVSRMTDEKGATWSRSGMSKVRSRPESLVADCSMHARDALVPYLPVAAVSAAFVNKKYVLSNSRVCPMQLFHFLITWRLSSSKSAAVYKISWKSDDFSLRYGDIMIFKMAAVRHLGIILPPYETTHEVSVAAHAAACQISCQSDTQIWRYSYLNCFAYLAWNAYSGPKNGGFGGLWTPKCNYYY